MSVPAPNKSRCLAKRRGASHSRPQSNRVPAAEAVVEVFCRGPSTAALIRLKRHPRLCFAAPIYLLPGISTRWQTSQICERSPRLVKERGTDDALGWRRKRSG